MSSARLLPFRLARSRKSIGTIRAIHSTTSKTANVAPVVGTGPPPEAPIPEAREYAIERVERRRRQAEMLKQAKDIRNAKGGKGGLKRRFWKTVTVQEVDGSLQIHLDARPLRHPTTRSIIRLPLSKRSLAWALAVEWDSLASAAQATKEHLIPLTSLVCRALDIAEDDAVKRPEEARIRTNIAKMVLRYLDTDSMLCWAPPAGKYDRVNAAGESLREMQKRIADDVVSYLTTHVWPGITIIPVLDGDSISPRRQGPGVREVIQGWISGLGSWEIAGLERAVLASKSCIAAARLIAEWSDASLAPQTSANESTFGVDDAAKATNLETDWQTQQWGEVEDTHDVNKEDLKRQLGGAILLVSGDSRKL